MALLRKCLDTGLLNRSRYACIQLGITFQKKNNLRGESMRQSSSFVGKNFLTLRTLSREEITDLLWVAMDLKDQIKIHGKTLRPLEGKTLALIFEKKSTRTRVSTETAFSVLGGKTIFLTPDDAHIGVNESLKDTSRVLSRLVDIVLTRIYSQSALMEIAKEATIPVVNGLTEIYHPLQGLADFLTLQEHFKSLKGLTMAWVGDGNNILISLMMAAPKLGVNMKIATPKGYEVDSEIADATAVFAKESGTKLEFTNDPVEAVKDSNVIVTDTWINFGQEEERAERLRAFDGFQVTMKMASVAAPNWRFLHCLPRKPKEIEVDDEVFYSNRSLVWQEAENRKWTVMAVLLSLLQNYKPSSPKPDF